MNDRTIAGLAAAITMTGLIAVNHFEGCANDSGTDEASIPMDPAPAEVPNEVLDGYSAPVSGNTMRASDEPIESPPRRATNFTEESVVGGLLNFSLVSLVISTTLIVAGFLSHLRRGGGHPMSFGRSHPARLFEITEDAVLADCKGVDFARHFFSARTAELVWQRDGSLAGAFLVPGTNLTKVELPDEATRWPESFFGVLLTRAQAQKIAAAGKSLNGAGIVRAEID